MSVIRQMLKDMHFEINPVQVGEIIIIVAILIVAIYIFYSLNLFKKEQ